MPNAELIIAEFDKLVVDRAPLDKILRECAQYACPEKSDFFSSTPGDSRPKHIIINEVIEAAGYFARGTQSNLMPTNMMWFRFNATDPKVAESTAVKEYFSACNTAYYFELINSNFLMEFYEAFEDAGWAGTMNVAIEEDEERTFRFTNYHISDYYVKEDFDKKIRTTFRRFERTAEQAIMEFPDGNLSKELTECAVSKKPEDRARKFEFIHVVRPRHDRKYNKETGEAYQDPMNLPWAEIYIEKKNKTIVREGGFHENPFTVGRVEKKAKQVYGHSPAMTCLRSAKILNKIWMTCLKAGEKQVDQPVMLNAAAYTKGLSPQFKQNPGSVNLYDGTQPNSAPQFQQQGNGIPISLELFDRTKGSVDNSFFVDMFAMIAELNKNNGRQRTAYEIQQLVAEKNAQIIPLVGRLLEELITPTLEKGWKMMERKEKFPPRPEELDGVDVNITYISPLALATRMVDVNVFFDYLQTIAPLAEINPGVVASRIDVDKAITTISNRMGVSTDFTFSSEEAADNREELAAQQQKQMESEQQLELAKSQNLNEKPQEGSAASAIGAMLGG